MNDRGFSLLEALVALAILSAVVTTSLSIASSSMYRSAEALEEFRAFMMADAILQRAGPEIPLVPGRTSGRLNDGGVWSLSIERSEGSGRGAPRFDVTAEVAPISGRAVILRTLTDSRP
jgi:prepilin-type N-terminal cleavage/methylation domain-containing protein